MSAPMWAFRKTPGTDKDGKPTVTLGLRLWAVPVLLLAFLWDTIMGKTLVKAPKKRARGSRRI